MRTSSNHHRSIAGTNGRSAGVSRERTKLRISSDCCSASLLDTTAAVSSMSTLRAASDALSSNQLQQKHVNFLNCSQRKSTSACPVDAHLSPVLRGFTKLRITINTPRQLLRSPERCTLSLSFDIIRAILCANPEVTVGTHHTHAHSNTHMRTATHTRHAKSHLAAP